MTRRDNALDLMKIILVLQMITAHIVQFFPAGTRMALFSEYANLTTFSGFMFVFGYVGYKAYFSNADRCIGSLIRHIIKTLIAFYISGIAITFFVYRDLYRESFIEIITLKRVPGYSEFLLSYACIYLLILMFKIFFPSTMSVKPSWLMIFVVISLMLTFIDYQCVTNNLLGSIVGTCNYPSFPIIQYMSYYVAGVYLAKKNKTFAPLIFVLSIMGTGAFVYFFKTNGYLPQRFPPCIYWIAGGWFFVYMYYLISKFVCGKLVLKIPDWLMFIGRNTLVFLVLSNVVIFTFRYYVGNWYDSNNIGYGRTIMLYVIIMLACLAASYTIIGVKKLAHKMEIRK